MTIELLEKTAAYRATNGECGWTRDQVPGVVAVLQEKRFAILGGELWWVADAIRSWSALIAQREGPDGVYGWETTREPGESWSLFVKRCGVDTLGAVAKWPDDGIRPNLPGRILYNSTWVSESRYEQLGSRAG